MRRIKRLACCSLSCLVLSLSGSANAPQAAAAVTAPASALTAVPAIVDTGGKAGETVTSSFRLINRTKNILPIRLTARQPLPKNGQSENLLRTLSADKWVLFDKPDFILLPDMTENVTVRLVIPADAAPGSHYADVVVRPLELEQTGGQQIVSPQAELIVQLFAQVAGKTRVELSAAPIGRELLVTPTPGRVTVSFGFKNGGNTHSLTQAETVIRQGNRVISRSTTGPLIILPGEVKRVDSTLPDNLPTGRYSITLEPTGYSAPRFTGRPLYVRVIPFDPKLLALIPAAGIAAYAIRIRKRIMRAVKIITKGV